MALIRRVVTFIALVAIVIVVSTVGLRPIRPLAVGTPQGEPSLKDTRHLIFHAEQQPTVNDDITAIKMEVETSSREMKLNAVTSSIEMKPKEVTSTEVATESRSSTGVKQKTDLHNTIHERE